jgi:hypothetical protein
MEEISSMSYQHDRDLNMTYSPDRGYFHFVLYIEPPATPGSAINASQIVEASTSRYAAEWRDRLISCDPDALHVSLVTKDEAPNLWHPCVYDDPNSPSAIAGEGCVCWQTFQDPVTLLPVVADHYRTVSGNSERWRHFTYAPLSLRDGERLDKLIIDREADMFWVRTDRGTLHILPEKQGAGYGTGYSGGGPSELTGLIEKIVKSDGYDVTPGIPNGVSNQKVFSWVSSGSADRTQELTLADLKVLCQPA